MKFLTSFLFFFLVSSNMYATDLALFNTHALREKINTPISLIREEKSTSSDPISPVIIETDIRNERIVGASLYYPMNQVNLESARAAINQYYAKYEYEKLKSHDFGAWRITSEAFTITLSKEIQNEDESYIILIYAIWIGTENMTFHEK